MRWGAIVLLCLALASSALSQDSDYEAIIEEDGAASSVSTPVPDTTSNPSTISAGGSSVTTSDSTSPSGGSTSSASSTVSGQTEPTGGSTVSGGTTVSGSTGSTEYVSTVPTTTGTTKDPVTYQTVAMNNPITVNDGKSILQEALVLSNHVSSLAAQINQLKTDMDVNNSPFLAELDQMQTNATAMNNTLIELQGQLATLTATEANVTSTYTVLASYYTCFATSNCVSDAPTTTVSTTQIPTTTIAMTACPTPSSYTNTDTTNYMNISQTAVSNINCSDTISAGSQNVNLKVTVNITGTAQLTITNGYTAAVVKSFNASAEATEVSVNGSIALFSYSAVGDGNEISFEIQYKAADPCDDKECGEHGRCAVTSTGTTHCVCQDCWQQAPNGTCTVEPADVCDSPAAKRICKVNSGGTCAPSADCTTYQCTPPPLASVLVSDLSMNAMKEKDSFLKRWLNW